MKPIRILTAAALLAACTMFHARASVIDVLRAGGPLIIAHRESSVPFSYLDEGKPVGYAMDLCMKIGEALRRKAGVASLKYQYLLVTSANRVAAIESGKAHLECGSTTNNAERRQKVAFAIPHFVTGSRLLVRSGSTVERIEDLMNKKVVSTTGTTPLKVLEQYNRERLLRLDILQASDHARAVEMVEQGEAEAFVMDDVLLYGLAMQRPRPEALKVVGKFLTTEALAVMLPKGDGELKKVADDEIRRMIYSGEMMALYDKWFTRPIPPRNASLGMPASYLLKDFWKYPSDFVPF